MYNLLISMEILGYTWLGGWDTSTPNSMHLNYERYDITVIDSDSGIIFLFTTVTQQRKYISLS